MFINLNQAPLFPFLLFLFAFQWVAMAAAAQRVNKEMQALHTNPQFRPFILLIDSGEKAFAVGDMEHYALAQKFFLKAEEWAIKNNNRAAQRAAMGGLANIYSTVVDSPQDLQKAEEIYKKLIPLSLEQQDTFYAGYQAMAYAILLTRQRRPNEAEATLTPYIARLSKASLRTQAMLQRAQALIQIKKGNAQQAVFFYRQCLTLLKEINEPWLERYARNDLTNLYIQQNDYQNALAVMRPLLLKEDTADVPSLVLFFNTAAKAYAATGKFDSAYHCANRSLFYQNKLKNDAAGREIQELRARYRAAETEHQLFAKEQELLRGRWTLSFSLGFLTLIATGLAVTFVFYRKQKRLSLQLAVQNDLLQKKEMEKTVLLRELHHRVKNNLQMLSSMLRAQGRRLQDPAAKQAVDEGRARVEALTLAHKDLYRGEDVTSMELQSYLSELAHSVLEAYSHEGESRLHFQADEIMLEVDQAISIGLLVNELLTNACKYARRTNQTLEISLELKRIGPADLRLKFADNGPGTALPQNLQTVRSYGLKLIGLLTEQLNGFYDIQSNNGLVFDFTFHQLKLKHENRQHSHR